MSEPEITNLKRTKNPKRVEQGKRLAAISREAKERKKQQQEKFFESTEEVKTVNAENKILFGIGLIGAAFLIYKIFLRPKGGGEVEHEAYTKEGPEDSPVDEVHSPTDEVPSSSPSREKRSFKPYTMD